MVIQLRLKMGGETATQQIQVLTEYLFKVQNWDYKEMYLFTFIMNQIDNSVILTQVNRSFKRAADPLYLERNLNLTILLDEAHFEFLKRFELDYAQKIFNKLTSLVINKTFHTVQGFYTINQALHNLLVKGRAEDQDKIVRLHDNFIFVGADFLALRLKNRYIELQPIYSLPDIEWTTV